MHLLLGWLLWLRYGRRLEARGVTFKDFCLRWPQAIERSLEHLVLPQRGGRRGSFERNQLRARW